MRAVRVEVRRRGGNGDELIVDIAVKAPDGSTVHRHPLDFATQMWSQVLHRRLPATPTRARLAHAIEWQPWREHAEPATAA